MTARGPLCAREIALMRRLGRAGAVRFVDVATVEAGACPLDRAALLARFHACEDGRVLSGAAAFAAGGSTAATARRSSRGASF